MPGSTKSCDVLIVGGGPAGLATAIALRGRGMDVLLADAQTPPIDKACGEGIMPDSRSDLARLGIELSDDLGAKFYGIRFCDQKSSVRARFLSGCGLGVRRLTLHQSLADQAAQAGVRLAWKKTIVARPGQPIVLDGTAVRYRYLVGADGQSSRVRMWAGLNSGQLLTERFGFRIHCRLARSAVSQQMPDVEVHWAQNGQAYITAVSEDEICVAVLTRTAGTADLRRMIDSIPELRRRLEGAEIISSQRGAVTSTRRLKHVVRGNVALVGDASGSVDAITGEGLALGFRQAMLLADAIEAGDFSHYDRQHPAVMRLPRTMARIMLLMDRWPALRGRVLKAMAEDPAIFETMLDVHLGEEPLGKFVLTRAPGLGLRLLGAPAA